ncbi:hypothetical protein Tco_0790145 [Tanacetum coccineum]
MKRLPPVLYNKMVYLKGKTGFYVIEPNDSILINSKIESRDAIFDENRFSSFPRPNLRIPNGTEDIGGSVVPEEVVQQPEPELRKSKRNSTPKNVGLEFQLYLIERIRDEENRFSSVPRPSLRILNGTEDIGGSVVPEEVTEEEQGMRSLTNTSYCFNVEDDPKTFDEAIKSQNVAFWKEAINDKMDSIMGNNTWVLDD